ncbi:MAG: hypothetical protein ACE5DM_05395, partial [Candidatus Nanoarchaeia archaeon]
MVSLGKRGDVTLLMMAVTIIVLTIYGAGVSTITGFAASETNNTFALNGTNETVYMNVTAPVNETLPAPFSEVSALAELGDLEGGFRAGKVDFESV